MNAPLSADEPEYVRAEESDDLYEVVDGVRIAPRPMTFLASFVANQGA